MQSEKSTLREEGREIERNKRKKWNTKKTGK